MIDQLERDSTRIPQPTRGDMMRMLDESFKDLNIDYNARFKSLWVTNALDGSEDNLVSKRIHGLVGEKMTSFRNELMKTQRPKTLKKSFETDNPTEGGSTPW